MRTPYVTISRLLVAAAIPVLGLQGAAQAQTTQGTPSCWACIIWNGYCAVGSSTNGYVSCRCVAGDCSCGGECHITEAKHRLSEIERDHLDIPPAGLALVAAPSQRYLHSLSRARIRGALAEGVYMGRSFAVVIWRDGSTRVYPLQQRDVFEIRDCRGELVARAYRDGNLT